MKIADMQVTLVDTMGTDLSVVNAARVSFDKESAWDLEAEDLQEKDKKLINYLAKHNHFTPFTHCSTTFRIKVPIFVARQLHKHQVGFTVNEVSRRYVDSEPEFWFPDVWRGKPVNAKQGSDGIVHPPSLWGFDHYNEDHTSHVQESVNFYKHLLGNGVAPEQARMVLPQNTMTEFWMTGSLYGWARVCNLRLDSHAQKEIQEVAHMIDKEMYNLFPVSWKALMNYE